MPLSKKYIYLVLSTLYLLSNLSNSHGVDNIWEEYDLGRIRSYNAHTYICLDILNITNQCFYQEYIQHVIMYFN